jgi:hypothetical protein
MPPDIGAHSVRLNNIKNGVGGRAGNKKDHCVILLLFCLLNVCTMTMSSPDLIYQ